jgi:hypothetical protein
VKPNLGTTTSILTNGVTTATSTAYIAYFYSPAVTLDTRVISQGTWYINLFAVCSSSGSGLVYWVTIDETNQNADTVLANIATGTKVSGTAVGITLAPYTYTINVPNYVLASTISRIKITVYASTASGTTNFTIYTRGDKLSNVITTLALNSIGATGTTGYTGYTGPQGATGSTGFTGYTGYT